MNSLRDDPSQPVFQKFFFRGLLVPCVLAFACGCASMTGRSPQQDSRRALRHLPSVATHSHRSDQALVAAFFAANGIRLSTGQIQECLSDSAPLGRLNRQAVRNTARQHNRTLSVVKADEELLWEALGANQPLLVLLPPGTTYSPSATPMIPVAWDRSSGTLDLLDGNGIVHSLPAADFFERRDPLKHAALLLTPSSGLRPSREQTLLLTDFWYDQIFYRNVPVVFSPVQTVEAPLGTDLHSLLDQGASLIRKGRFKEAIPVFQAALALDPDNAKILTNLAYCMLNGDGLLMTALRHANKAVDLDPHNPLALETLGTINLRLGDAPAAAQYLERALARALHRPPEVQIAIMDQLVRAWLGAHREDLAWQVAEFRHRTFPQYQFPMDILRYFPALLHAPTAMARLPGQAS